MKRAVVILQQPGHHGNQVISAEVLVYPKVGDVQTVIGEVVEHFSDRRYRAADPGT